MNEERKMTENERLAVLQRELGFNNQTEFAAALGKKQGSLSDIYRQKGGVGVSKSIKSILREKYSVNLNWLETGEGSMFIDGSESSPPPRDLSDADAKFREYVYIKDAQIDELLRQNGKLIKIIEMLTEKLK